MLRLIVKVLLVILDILLLETALVGLPESIIGQIEYLSTLDDGFLLRAIAIVLALCVALLAVGPNRLGEWQRTISAKGLGMGERRNDEESARHVDYRSVTSSGQMGGQIAWNITNEGPQPREISHSAGDALVKELQKYDPEQFQISWMMDAESAELGTMLQELLEQGGWQMTMQVSGAMLSGGPPRGVFIETAVDSKAVDTLVSWLTQVNLNPYVNKGEEQFGILKSPFEDDLPAPVHIVVGVLPR